MAYAEGSGVGVSWFRRWRRTIFLATAVLFAAWIATGFYATWYHANERKTADVVAHIQAQKITMRDVDGKNLPPTPDPKLVDATVEGVDANDNGIRDDVELAIFKMYPNSPYTRAAELQYAMAQQMYLTQVFDTETWKAVAVALGRATQCIGEAYPRTDIQKGLDMLNQRTREVESLVFNTVGRRSKNATVGEFTTSYGDSGEVACDVIVE